MATHVRARESEGTACVVVSGTRFESYLFIFCTYCHAHMGTHVWPRTYGLARAKERPVWLFLARGLKVDFFFPHTATHVRARTYGHVLVYKNASFVKGIPQTGLL